MIDGAAEPSPAEHLEAVHDAREELEQLYNPAPPVPREPPLIPCERGAVPATDSSVAGVSSPLRTPIPAHLRELGLRRCAELRAELEERRNRGDETP